MEFRPVARAAGAFQETVSASEILALCHRGFGQDAVVLSAIELDGGLYNNTYRIEFPDRDAVILRVAPEPGRQFRIERRLMRGEQTSLPFFAPIAAMMPRTLFADWTHDLIGRDYVFQTILDGVPAARAIHDYPRPAWAALYRQLGAVTKTVHSVRGERFGPVTGPGYDHWSEAVIRCLEDTAADLEDAGLDASDMRAVATVAAEQTEALDAIEEPRLLHGDLWTPNLMLAPKAPEPLITGVLDHDRAWWGDPAADWSVFVASGKSAAKPFWDTYGTLPCSADANWRALIYRARHLGAIRLERHRLGRDDRIADTYHRMREVLDLLTT
ncbi:phosphotransferase family protein [Amycolatopsis pigmentata]|uniref:Phosphotransferase family protein n=1 Tax=Amycolatopsis pigmentata TaxID=450801 RepID=A0ABW5FMB3_9PSEU